MKKIPTLFERVFENHMIVDILPKVTPGMEWVLDGKGDATVKWDGSCCAIIDGEFYKRFDAKPGRKIPDGAIPCCEPDPVTGHYPHWVKCDRNNKADKWFWSAYDLYMEKNKEEITTRDDESRGFAYPEYKYQTFEAVGKHFTTNPYNFDDDILIPHGRDIVYVERSFEGIKEFLSKPVGVGYIEGLVFWIDGEPKCKIKRTDFGFEWGKKK